MKPRTRLLANKPSGRRGMSTIFVIVCVSALMSLSLCLLNVVSRAHTRVKAKVNDDAAFLLAEAAIDEATASLVVGSSGAIGSQAAPVRLGDGAFWVEATPAGDSEWTLRSTALVGAGRASVEALVRRNTRGGITRPLVSEKKLDLKKDMFIDSYDSRLGTYASQAVNLRGTVRYARSNATVVSNGDVRLHEKIAVFGSVRAGPEAQIKYKKSSDPNLLFVTGTIAKNNIPYPLPDVIMPEAANATVDLHLHGDSHTSGFDVDLAPGRHHYKNFKVHKDGEVRITGPAEVIVDSKLDLEARVVIDDTNGPVVFYVGKEAKFKKKNILEVASNSPAGLFVVMAHPEGTDENGKPKKIKHKVKLEGKFTGIVYGPKAKIELKKEADVFGSLMGNQIKFKKGARFHFDEALEDLNNPFGGDQITVERLSSRRAEVTDATLRSRRGDPFALLGVHREDLRMPSDTWVPGSMPTGELAFDPWGPDDFEFDDDEGDAYDDSNDNLPDEN